jgi:hypothetical protein
MSLDGSYDMILLPPPRDSENGGRQPARRRHNRRRLPHVAEEQHSGLSRRLPRRRRRRRGNQGHAGGGTSSAVEQVDGAGAPTGDTSGIDPASETKTSAVSPQHANSKWTDDASTLAKDLLGITLVPETTVQSAPDATPSSPVDQEVPTDSHLVPFGFSLDPPSNFASVEAFIEPGCSGNTSPRDAGAINHRRAAYPGRAQESPGGCRGPTGRKLCLPKAGLPLGASRRDFPIHAGSLGPHRAHAQHSACGPGSPRQRAPSPQPSSPPRREGAPRLPPQAWGTLRQWGGSELMRHDARSSRRRINLQITSFKEAKITCCK